MTPIENRVELHGVITSERSEKRSTAEAYRMVDTAKCSVGIGRVGGAVRMAAALERGDFDTVCREAYNIFGDACGYPDDVRKLLLSLGAPFVLMSGAGPSVVALTESAGEADNLLSELKNCGCTAYGF